MVANLYHAEKLEGETSCEWRPEESSPDESGDHVHHLSLLTVREFVFLKPDAEEDTMGEERTWQRVEGGMGERRGREGNR